MVLKYIPDSRSMSFKAGVTNIVTALDDVPPGEVWTLSALQQLRSIIEEEGGLSWTIVEVLPVHEAIKSGKTRALREKCGESVGRQKELSWVS